MPLTYSPNQIINKFEGSVVRTLSQLEAEGYIAHNILLPKVNNRYRPDEHDIVVLLPWAAYTIDAKEYAPGYYNIPGNSPSQWRRFSPEFTKQDGKTKVLGNLPNPFHVAKQKGSILHSLCKKADRQLENYPTQSIIVVPDHAEVTPEFQPYSREEYSFELRVLKLSQLVDAIVADGKAHTGRIYTMDQRRRIFEEIQALPQQPTQGISLCGVRLDKELRRSEPGCPVSMTAYEGVKEMSGTKVEVRIYCKWPWNENSDRFLDRLHRRLNAIERVYIPHLMQVIVSEDLPDLVVLAFIHFPGKTLAELLKRERSLSVPIVKSLIRYLAGTVKELHQCDIIHHDIRPEHVLVAPNLNSHGGQEHLLVGLTSPLIDDGCLSTQVFGDDFESSFSAPEMQAHRHPDRGKPQSDIFSLGRLAAYCLLGDAKYRQRLGKEGIDLDLQGELQGIDAHFKSVIEGATQYRSSQRYANIDEMLAALSK